MTIICPKCHHENQDDSIYCGQCTTPLKPSEKAPIKHTETLQVPTQELTRGSVFAERYEVIEELGKGGMGKVYRVEDKKIKEEVALKLIKPEIASDKKTIERFSNELKTARQIAHRHVCKMYDLGESEGAHFITMEYVPSEDLKGMIRMTKRLSVATAIDIAKQVCEGLSEAHRLGIIHRDLKPSNIMIDKGGNARIMDFGIARSLKTKGITGSGVMIGTPEYMSPEQVESKEVDQRSDIYSLGIILYEMVTGHVPFEGDTPFSIGVKHKSEIPKAPKEINANIPDDLNQLILKCLEKEREKRYQSAGELRSELTNIEKGIPTTEAVTQRDKPTTSKEITVTFRRRWLWAPVLIVAVILIGIGIIFLRREKPAKPAKEQKMLVVLPFENLGNPDDEYFANGMTEEITSRLSVLHGLGVISRSSAIQYKGTNKTIKQIGEELGVDYVLEGTVRWDRSPERKGRVRVTPQLNRVSDDTHLWSERYDRVIEDIFEVQSDISEQVIKQLDLTVLEPERQALFARPTDNLEAYDLMMQARDLWNEYSSSLDFQHLEKSIQLMEEAIELDPESVIFYTGLSHLHRVIYFMGHDQTEERLEKWKAVLDNAQELRPDMPEVNEALAYYYYQAFLDYDRALERLEYVQKVRPNASPFLLAVIQRRQGKWEQSLINLEKAFKLNPQNAWFAYEVGITYMDMRMYDKAELWLNRSLTINPNELNAQLAKFYLYLTAKGDTRKARGVVESMPINKDSKICWFDLCFKERNYKEAIDRLNALSFEYLESQNYYFNKDLAFASVYFAQKELSLIDTHAESARMELEKAVQEHPQDPRYHSALGIAYAYLGMKDRAIGEGKYALELYPVSKDALQGINYVYDIALIYTLIGEYEDAIDQLEYLMSIPSGSIISVRSLRLWPYWDPLRDHPRFQQLLEKYSEKEE